jgi:peroxiredoxin
VAIGASAVIVGSRADPRLTGTGLGNTAAPDFTLRSTGGATVRMQDYRGKVVLLNFWATWCEPCKAELPAIDAVQRRYGSQGFAALGVDFRDQDEDVVAYAAKVRLSFPLLEDQPGVTANDYRLLGVPTSYLVDAEGVIRAIHTGPYTQKGLAGAVGALLAKGAP